MLRDKNSAFLFFDCVFMSFWVVIFMILERGSNFLDRFVSSDESVY